MNRSEMREMLKTCLNEPAGAVTDFYSIVELNSLLNRGLLWVEMRVLQINPVAFLAVDSFGQVALKNIYPTPTGAISIRKVVRASDGKRIARRDDGFMDNTYKPGVGENLTNVAFATSPTHWCPFGRFMRFGATPDNTLANAILVTYVPSLTMADDSDVPQMVEGLFDAVVNKAWSLGIRPNADISQKAAASRALEESLVDITQLAGVPTDESVQILPDFDPGEGFFGQSPVSPWETR